MLAPFKLENPFSFPANRRPGFDASHPLISVSPLSFSTVAQNGNFVNVQSGHYGTITPGNSPPVARLDSIIGPSVFYPLVNGTGRITMSGVSVALNTITVAAIVRLSSLSSGTIFHNTTNGNTGVELGIALNKVIFFAPGNTGSAQSSFNLLVNVPYFLVASWNGSVVNFAAARLDTGAVASSSQAFTGKHRVGNGVYIIGNTDSFDNALNGNIAAVAYTTAAITIAQLRAICADPWSFWYPPVVERAIGFSLRRPITQPASSATFNGTGSLSVQTLVTKAGVAQFNGSGSLSVILFQAQQASAVFNGTGSLSVNAFVYKFATAEFDGSGSLSVTTIAALFAAATFNGTGSLYANTARAQNATVVFNGTGSLTAFASNPSQNRATFNGSGSLSVTVRQTLAAFVQFNGTGSLSVNAQVNKPFASEFDGAGRLSVTVFLALVARVQFNGTGSLSVHALTPSVGNACMFNGSGSMSIASGIFIPFALFNGNGRMCVNGYQRKGTRGPSRNRVITGPGPTTSPVARGGTSGDPGPQVCEPCSPAQSTTPPVTATTTVVIGLDGTPLIGADGSSLVESS